MSEFRTHEPDRWSVLWLAVAAVGGLFVGGKWAMPLAAWVFPIFLLRFLRTQKLWPGLALGYLALVLPAILTFQGMAPGMEGVSYVVFMAVMTAIAFLPYVADRLIATRIRGFAATLVYPLTCGTVEALNASRGAYGSFWALAGSQVGVRPLVQIVSVTGFLGLSFLVLWFRATVNWAWSRGFAWKRVWRGVAIYAGVLAAVLVYGSVRLAFLAPEARTVRVAGIIDSAQLWTLVQDPAFLDAYDRVLGGQEPSAAEVETLRAVFSAFNEDFLQRTEREAQAGAKIVFWNEGGGMALKQDEAPLVERGRQLARQEGIYLGMAIGTLASGRERPMENKVVLIEPSGQVAWEYHKARPVPGQGEGRSLAPGDGVVRTLDTPYGRIASVICFDMDFPDLIRQAGQAGVDLLFVPTNDWREVADTRARTAHLRAVENGLTLIRPVLRGTSLAVDPWGRVLAQTNYFTADEAVLIAQVPTQGVRTLYARIGPLFGWLCVAGLIGVVGWTVVSGVRQRLRRRRDRPESTV